jgi:hypothetical protein
MENHGETVQIGENPDMSTRPLCQSYQQSHLVAKQEEINFTLRSKILLHGAGGFSSPPKEDVLRIFISLKNLLSSVGFEAVSLGSEVKHTNH